MSSFVLVGKPNSGKSLLFNRLTGLTQKVANFPGVTVEVKRGYRGETLVIDSPGIYTLNPLTQDEKVAVAQLKRALAQEDLKGILCVADATRLERSLYLAVQIQELAAQHQQPFVLVVNMLDEIEFNQTSIDLPGLAQAMGVRQVGISARTGRGMADLDAVLEEMVAHPEEFIPRPHPERDRNLRQKARELARKFGPEADLLLKRQNFLDRFFLSHIWGGLIFFAIMTVIFQSIFTWATPLMDFVEESVSYAGSLAAGSLPEGVVADFVADALFGGFGSFLVFVPQIFVMFMLVGLLEDSGYLARAAVICHRPLSYFGLSGKSFVPYLSGHACSIPAMMAARTIESPKQRLLTLFTIPLMACSARLPVYSLLIAAVVPPVTFGGVIGYQGLAFFGLYVFGMVTALVVSSVLAKTTMKKVSEAPFIMELPPYRIPLIRPLIRRSTQASWFFITKAGPIIFMVTAVVWVLGYFPGGEGELASSWLASLGRWIEPVFAPLGLDWRYGVAILASFLAREVFVGTLGTLFGIEGADDRLSDVKGSIQADGFTPASAIALLVFYAIALQCVSTLAVMRKETGQLRIPLAALGLYSVLAYVLAFLAYQLASFFF